MLLAKSFGECFGVVIAGCVLLGVGAGLALVAGAIAAFVFSMVVVIATIFKNFGIWQESGMTFEGAVRTLFAVLMVAAFVIVPLVIGRIVARERHYVHVHNVRPETSGVGHDVAEPPSWLAVLGAVAGAAGTIAFVVAYWSDEGIPAAWDDGVSVIGRAFLTIVYAVFGVFGAALGVAIFFGLHWCWQTRGQWRAATRRSHVGGG
jgi:hypothetical protein